MSETAAEAHRLLQLVVAITGESQYVVMERLLRAELERLRQEGKLP
jgi:hypothetical protein